MRGVHGGLQKQWNVHHRQIQCLRRSCGALRTQDRLFPARRTRDTPGSTVDIRWLSDKSTRDSSEEDRKPPTVEDEFDPKELFRDQNNTWVDNKVPQWMQPYCKIMRIDRPIGRHALPRGFS